MFHHSICKIVAMQFVLATFLQFCTNAFSLRPLFQSSLENRSIKIAPYSREKVGTSSRTTARDYLLVLKAFDLDGVEPDNSQQGKKDMDQGIPDDDEIFYSQLRQRMAELQMEEESESTVKTDSRYSKGEEEEEPFDMPSPIMGISRPPMDQFSQFREGSADTTTNMLTQEERDQAQAFSIVQSLLTFSSLSALGFLVLYQLAGGSFVHLRSTPSAVMSEDIQSVKTRSFIDADRILLEDFARSDSILFDNLRPPDQPSTNSGSEIDKDSGDSFTI